MIDSPKPLTISTASLFFYFLSAFNLHLEPSNSISNYHSPLPVPLHYSSTDESGDVVLIQEQQRTMSYTKPTTVHWEIIPKMSCYEGPASKNTDAQLFVSPAIASLDCLHFSSGTVQSIYRTTKEELLARIYNFVPFFMSWDGILGVSDLTLKRKGSLHIRIAAFCLPPAMPNVGPVIVCSDLMHGLDAEYAQVC